MFEFLKRLFVRNKSVRVSEHPKGDLDFSRLVTACFGDKLKAKRLIDYELGRMPFITREEAARSAVERLQDDRR